MKNLSFESGCLLGNRYELDKLAGSGGMGTVYRGPFF